MSETTAKKRNKSPKDVKEERNQEQKTELRYGPMPRFKNQRMWSRGIMLLGVFVYMWVFSKSPNKEVSLAAYKDSVENRGQKFDCDLLYLTDVKKYSGCAPEKCGRFVTDKLVTASEASTLLQMAKIGFTFGGSSGGASILDIHSGALSLGEKYVNIHQLKDAKKMFTAEYLLTYKIVKEKIQHAVGSLFDIDHTALHLTHPTFFSKLTATDPVTKHDEYWHPHVDKDTYESFHYTSLLYLSDSGVDFKGGRFIFQDGGDGKPTNMTIEPRLGRVSMFTSGEENLHLVERVTSGTRYAITISFTCDVKHSIQIPQPAA